MGGWVDEWVLSWPAAWADGWMGGWVDEWVGGWMGFEFVRARRRTRGEHIVMKCVLCLLLQYLLQSCSRGGGGGKVEDMCYERRRAEACVD